MKKIISKSDKRLIIEDSVSGKPANFLVDTGASVGLMDYDLRKEYNLAVGRKCSGTLVGAGGEMRNVRHCDTFAHIGHVTVPQFLLADIGHVVRSIEKETGIRILGILSLPQMQMAGIQIDANDNLIIIE